MSKHTDAKTRQDAAELLYDRLAKASALSAILYADGGEAFRNHSAQIQDEVLWLLSDLICEARDSLDTAIYVGPENDGGSHD